MSDMHIVTQDLPSRRAQVEICLQMEPAYSILDEDERHQAAATLFAQHDGIIACWPDAEGVDGYAVAVLKGIKHVKAGYAGGLRMGQFPCLPSDIEAQNLSALFGDDRGERRRNLRGYLRRRYGEVPAEAFEAARNYFDRYDRLYHHLSERERAKNDNIAETLRWVRENPGWDRTA
ncbi:hypothetical protein MPAR168_22800 [Methylorubrum populi]|uniref:DUF4375 domain-containing protein n=2 Tax=Hyphomicrobiales TaxID=356 RepID=A0ABU7TGZ0_9HYPH